MEIKGTIVQVNPVETVGKNNFKKSSIWIETSDQYPQTIEIEFVKDKADEIQSLGTWNQYHRSNKYKRPKMDQFGRCDKGF